VKKFSNEVFLNSSLMEEMRSFLVIKICRKACKIPMCKNIFFENENIFEQETVDILNLLHKRREKNIHKRGIFRTKFATLCIFGKF